MKPKGFKKYTALFLTLAMFMTFIPGFTLVTSAAEVANVTDLQTAISAGGIVILGDAIDLGSTVLTFPDNTPVTIDLNGKTLSKSSSGYVLELGTGDDVTITGNGTVSKAGGWYFFKNDSGYLKIEGGTYSKSGYDLVYMDGTSETEITGGEFELDNIFARQSEDSTGAIAGGSFNVDTISTGIWSEGISITGGTYTLNTSDTPVSGYVDTDNYNITTNADGSYTVSEKTAVPPTYTITVNGTTNGTVTADKATAAEGETVTLTVTPTTDYELDTLTVKDADDDDVLLIGNTFTMPAKNVTVTATFKVIPINHTITFIANNNTGETDSITVADGSNYTFNDYTFTYGKCKIESWNTKADGSGDTYYVGNDVTVAEDITLYAQWVLPLNELDAFIDGNLEWSGNGSSPYTFTMNNGAVLYARVILPSASSEDTTTITVDGNCEIKGSVSFVSGTGFYGSSYKGNLIIKGDGSLIFDKMVATGSGDSLTVYADTTINNEINIGASGGMDSCVAIEDATLEASGVVLLQYLTMEGKAKLSITNGSMSFHSAPELKLDSKSEIYITGNGVECVLYKEGDAHESFDNLKKNNWLPAGYGFKYDGGYCLYDKNNNLETDSVTIKKKTQTTTKPSGGGGATYILVKFDSNEGSRVENDSIRMNYKLIEPEAPVKDGFTFAGWYTDEELTIAYDFNSKVTKSFTLYAKWIKVNQDDDEKETSGHNCPSLKFNDLDISKWYHYDTDYVIEKDLFRGITKTIFAPDENITRAMFITVLYRAEGEPVTNKSIPFADIDMGAYYANAVVWAQQNGIIKGVSETEFAPNTDISRQQIATIMFRYVQYKGMDAVTLEENLHFDDAGEISEYAVSAMNWAVGKEIIKGYEDNTVRPINGATRAEIAAIIHRFFENNK
ncbi:MAG: InlB B-repeat-containing protein [Clostridia bacterium]|nr:InlB B-repeat-containing protein [Clostridia bacterium]